MLIYGDEIGMGKNLSLDGRNAVRTPMQWSSACHAGFSTATQRALTMPLVTKGQFGYRHINVEKQVADPDSTLNVVKRLIWVRCQCPEWGWGTCRALPTGEPGIFSNSCEWKGRRLIAVHNLTDKAASVRFDREPGTTLAGGDGVTDDVMVYRRELDRRRFLVGLNFSAQPRLTGVQARGKILLSTGLNRRNEPLNVELKLRGNEGILAELE